MCIDTNGLLKEEAKEKWENLLSGLERVDLVRGAFADSGIIRLGEEPNYFSDLSNSRFEELDTIANCYGEEVMSAIYRRLSKISIS